MLLLERASTPTRGRARAQSLSTPRALPCPRCGTSSTVHARDGSQEWVEQPCVACGGIWRWLAPGRDCLSLILALEVHATAAINDEHDAWRGVFRAARFTVRLPLRYRVVGSEAWSSGMSANISRSGLLCHTAPADALREALRSNPRVDITLEVPVLAADAPPHQVLFRARVVRGDEHAHRYAWATTVGGDISTPTSAPPLI